MKRAEEGGGALLDEIPPRGFEVVETADEFRDCFPVAAVEDGFEEAALVGFFGAAEGVEEGFSSGGGGIILKVIVYNTCLAHKGLSSCCYIEDTTKHYVMVIGTDRVLT